MEALKTLYHLFYSDRKERVEMVLEPLQAMTQLAIMTYCPVGSKLSISLDQKTVKQIFGAIIILLGAKMLFWK